MKPTIVTLTPRATGSNTIEVATFEEAFGEFSEFRGRGRARRQKRKLDRKAKRQERRMTRINNRRERKGARQAMRAEQQEARQTRKDTRKTRRVARKAMGQEEEAPESESGSEDSGYAEEEEAPAEESYEESPAYEEYSEEEAPAEEEEYSEEEEYEGADGDGLDGSPEGYFLNADGALQAINPKVLEVAKKIEKRKAFAEVLEGRKAARLAKVALEKDGQVKAQLLRELATIEKQMADNTKKITELEAKLQGYSSARGGRGGGNRRREARQAKRQAKREVRKERKAAKKERKRGGSEENGGSEEGTEVESNLDPRFSEQRIEVPAEESTGMDGKSTGLIGVDDINDYDSPEVRKFDVTFSNAEGASKTKINVKAIVIAVGVGLVAGYLINKYKLLGSK